MDNNNKVSVKRLIKKQAELHSTFINSTLAMILVFLLSSLFECFKNFQIRPLGYKLLNDLSMGLVIALFILPIYLLFRLWKEKLSNIITKTLFLIAAYIQLGLISYTLTTRVNLGADLIGYNLTDIINTVKNSVNISTSAMLPIFLFPMLFLYLIYFIQTRQNRIYHQYYSIGFLILANISWFLPNGERPVNQNKIHFLITDILRAQNDKKIMSKQTAASFKSEFPLEKPFNETPDALSPFFNFQKEKPNIVIIMVEGLGSDFVGNGEYKGFTPYLDGLISKSLYWQNFLSNAGRTFGVAPSLLGSLPFAENGFMEMEKLPKHNSLISVLKSNGYSTSYYDGGDAEFDRKRNFMEYQNIDHIIDKEKFGPEFKLTPNNTSGFSWGYPDREIFRKMLSEIDHYKKPRLDVVMTITNHEPFDFSEKPAYLKKVDQMLNRKSYFDQSKYGEFKDIFASLLYTDNSIKYFMESYAKRPEYNNTIFIITGDHRLIPIPLKDNLSRFHVPLYIFSPMLKRPELFKSVSSHRDITPSLISMLAKNYKIKTPEKTAWLGKGLDTFKGFRNTQGIAFMRYKGGLVDYLYKDYFYSDNILFKVDENFNLTEESDGDVYDQITHSFNDFKKLNAYLTGQNKIVKSMFGTGPRKSEYKFTPEEKTFIKQNTTGLTSDQVFKIAQKFAFEHQHQKARILCNYILNNHPNYGDVRILKGRTLAWDGDYKNSEKELLRAIEGSPYYFDCYSALMDIYQWSGQDTKSIQTGKKALENGVIHPEIGFKLAQSYKNSKNNQLAKKTIDSLIKIYPDNQNYLSFKKSI